MRLPRAKDSAERSPMPIHLDDTQNYRQMTGPSVEGEPGAPNGQSSDIGDLIGPGAKPDRPPSHRPPEA
jgi:hypothetical protein